MSNEKVTLKKEQIEYLRKLPVLKLVVYKEFFDKILSGEKIFEYRQKSQYWISRLDKFFEKEGFLIEFRNGYAKDAPKFTTLCLGIFEKDENDEESNFELELVSPKLITNLNEVLESKSKPKSKNSQTPLIENVKVKKKLNNFYNILYMFDNIRNGLKRAANGVRLQARRGQRAFGRGLQKLGMKNLGSRITAGATSLDNSKKKTS